VHRFLVKELERNNYILPHHRAAFYCQQLNLKFQEIGYYHDVGVWLPHEQWGIMFMPACKNYKCGTHVRQFSWPNSTTGCYYLMARQFACSYCMEAAKRQSPKNHRKPSWGGTLKPCSILPTGEESGFQHLFLHQSGVDKCLFNLLRALMNQGVRPKTFSLISSELHSINCFGQMIDLEYRLASVEAKEQDESNVSKGSLFSNFSDRQKYNGEVPTGRYFQQVFVTMSNYIGEFISNEGNKWPVSGLCIDTSYYITKILAKYHGAKMYDGIFSATSTNLGHLRLQTYVNGESHEECRPLLESLVESQKTFGHPLPRIVVSDSDASERRKPHSRDHP
jgi:hypothetical protein